LALEFWSPSLFTASCKCFSSERENKEYESFAHKVLTHLMNLKFLESYSLIKYDEVERGRYL